MTSASDRASTWEGPLTALLIGILLVLVAVLSLRRSRSSHEIRWWTILVFLTGLALIWMWFVYLRFPVVQPVD